MDPDENETDENDDDQEELCLSVREDCEGDDEECQELVPCNKNDNNEVIIEDNLTEDTPELCSDKKDNDGNGKSDCYDENCKKLDVCANFVEAATKEAKCKDGLDNDGDLEIDCDDADCTDLDICSDENDSDWTVTGGNCKASDLGLIKDSREFSDRAKNFMTLKAFLEDNENACSNIEVDGAYYFIPVRAETSTKPLDDEEKIIQLSRIVKFTGGTLNFGFVEDRALTLDENNKYNVTSVMRLLDGAGLVMDSVSLQSQYSHFIDSAEYRTKYHGTVDRLMFRNCEIEKGATSLFRIKGVYKHKTSGKQPYESGTVITKDELNELSTRVRRITIKDCKSKFKVSLTDVSVLDKFEFIHNEVRESGNVMHWSTNNNNPLATTINWQGNSHAIIRNNKIHYSDDIFGITGSGNSVYYVPFLIEAKTVNYEDNTIENLMCYLVNSDQERDPVTGEPKPYADCVKKKGTCTSSDYSLGTLALYDSYMSVTQLISRNNIIKNVIGLGSHLRTNKFHNELLKGKSCPYWPDTTRIRRFENNQWILEDDMLKKIENCMIDGCTRANGTTIEKMYVSTDDGKGKRELTQEEREKYIKNNTYFHLFIGTNIWGLNEFTFDNCTINMPNGAVGSSTSITTNKFSCVGNNITLRGIGKNHSKNLDKYYAGEHQLFEVYPYKYISKYSDAEAYGDDYFHNQNESLHTEIDVRKNNLNVSNTNEVSLVSIIKSSAASYVDEKGEKHLIPYEPGEIKFENNTGSNGMKVEWCEGANWYSMKCYQESKASRVSQ